ncbi:MAG: hypothetical protein ACNYPI_07625 [Arenicellales bacterium WSBS_2016_MAG_OTU3]
MRAVIILSTAPRAARRFVGRSGGLLADFTVHNFDMLAYLSDAAIAEVFARGANLLHDEAMLGAKPETMTRL